MDMTPTTDIPTIAVDFDDVVVNFNRAYINHHNDNYGDPQITFQDAVTFDMAKLYGITPNEVVKRVRRFCTNHHDDMTLRTGAREGLARLSDQFDLQIVTSRCESFRDITLAFMKENGVNKYFSHAHFTNGFGTVFPDRKKTKLEVCREIGAVALIEDSPGNAQLVADGGISVIVPECPWNTGQIEHELVHFVPDWETIPQTIEQMNPVT